MYSKSDYVVTITTAVSQLCFYSISGQKRFVLSFSSKLTFGKLWLGNILLFFSRKHLKLCYLVFLLLCYVILESFSSAILDFVNPPFLSMTDAEFEVI